VKHAIISSSAIAKYSRMDAGFFLALREVEAELPALQVRYTTAEAKALLAALAPSMKEAVLPLARGSLTNKQRSIEAACTEYPHIALALVRKNVQDRVQDLKNQQAADAKLLSKLEQLAE
jgi:hypothetical protein